MMLATGVFVTTATNALFSFHFTKCAVDQNLQVYTDIDAFKSSKHSRKVACFQMPYPVDPAFENTVTDLLPFCDNVLILMSELHDNTVAFIQRNDSKQISYFICGDLDWQPNHSPVHKFYDWFSTTVHFYKYEQPRLLTDQLTPYVTKPKMFDALLGRKKYHRDFVYDRIDKDNNCVTYLNDHVCDFGNEDKWRWESDGLEVNRPVEWTVDRVNYYGYNLSLSQIVPIEVYNETAYSLITETSYSNHYTFYTEKTVKPILGRRLFVAFSGKHSLRNLRSIGFKTFSDVIDESYDQVESLDQRFTMALEQVKYLSTQNQAAVLEKIRPICEHNFAHMMGTDWYRQYFMPAFVTYFLQT